MKNNTKRPVIPCLVILFLLISATKAFSDSYWYDLDFEPGCTYQEEPQPNPDMRLIGRLTDGISKIKGEHFWICGERLTGAAAQESAAAIAFRLVHYARRYGINPWGLAGTIANESRFDRCSLGINPRKWAMRKGLLEKKHRSISYSLEDVERVIYSKAAKRAFRKSGFDLGYCQILSRFYLTTHGTPSDMLSADKGLEICAAEMQNRATKYKTKRPWLYWRGSRTEWYAKRVRRWARRLGARRGEI